MGDEKQYYTIQVKGTAYRFAPLTPEEIKRVVMISQMDPTGLKSFRVLSQVLAKSAGNEQWGALLDRYIAGELEEVDFTAGVFGRLIKRQGEDERKQQAPQTLAPAADAQ